MKKEPPIRIQRSTLSFLSDLEANNDREWFAANKQRYLVAQENMKQFADALLERMQRHDNIATESGAKSLMRIYTDQRFHKDRPPYAPRFGGRLARVKPALRGGYFFRIQPGGRSTITCGSMGPNAADLRLIRMDVLYDLPTWKKLLQAKHVRANFNTLQGKQLRTAPRGFPKDHPGIDLLRHTQFLLRRPVPDKQVLAPDFLEQLVSTLRSARPWFDHMSAVLTTDENGR
jgi:uncharacterized protein (TIGR02453 family)